MKRKILFIASYLVVSISMAQESTQGPMALSLSDAHQYALGHNLTLENVRLDYESAKKKIWETAAAGMPQISASTQWQYTITPIPTIQLAPGQDVALGTLNNLGASASLDQLIFNGSYLVGLKAARIYRSMSELGVEKGQIEIKAAVAQAYYLALMSSETTQILKQNLELIGQTLQQMRRTHSEGFTDRTSVDKIEVSYNQLYAQVRSGERQIKNTRDMLKYIIGMPMDTPIELTDKLNDVISQVPTAYLAETNYDQGNHIDVKIAHKEVELLDLQRQLVASEWLPSLGAKLMYQYNFTLPEFSFQRASSAYLGIGLSVPIFKSGATRAKYSQAKFALQQSQNKETLARQSLDLEFQQASNQFKLSWDVYSLQKQNLELAARVLDNTKKSLSEGVSTSTDLIQANNSYLEAVTALLQSQINLLDAKIRMDKIFSR